MTENKQPDQATQSEEDDIASRKYDPNKLLNTLIQRLGLKNDAALARALEVAPPVISKIRHLRLPVGASLLIRMHEVSGMSIYDLRKEMGDRRTKFRISKEQFKIESQPAAAKKQAAKKAAKTQKETA